MIEHADNRANEPKKQFTVSAALEATVTEPIREIREKTLAGEAEIKDRLVNEKKIPEGHATVLAHVLAVLG